MQCKKCDIDIPAQFEYVLTKNVCPKCGNKLMADTAMKVYVDLKKRLNEVEFVMDKATVCERVAMFLITNYEIAPINGSTLTKIKTASETADDNKQVVEQFKAQLAAIADADSDLSPEEIRRQEAARAEEIAEAREMDLDTDEMLEDGEELVTGRIDADRIQRLKKLAIAGNTGIKVRRVEP